MSVDFQIFYAACHKFFGIAFERPYCVFERDQKVTFLSEFLNPTIATPLFISSNNKLVILKNTQISSFFDFYFILDIIL
jgi:hypothetical protein